MTWQCETCGRTVNHLVHCVNAVCDLDSDLWYCVYCVRCEYELGTPTVIDKTVGLLVEVEA